MRIWSWMSRPLTALTGVALVALLAIAVNTAWAGEDENEEDPAASTVTNTVTRHVRVVIGPDGKARFLEETEADGEVTVEAGDEDGHVVVEGTPERLVFRTMRVLQPNGAAHVVIEGLPGDEDDGDEEMIVVREGEGRAPIRIRLRRAADGSLHVITDEDEGEADVEIEQDVFMPGFGVPPGVHPELPGMPGMPGMPGLHPVPGVHGMPGMPGGAAQGGRDPMQTIMRWLMENHPTGDANPLQAWFDGGPNVPLAGLRDALKKDGFTANDLVKWFHDHLGGAAMAPPAGRPGGHAMPGMHGQPGMQGGHQPGCNGGCRNAPPSPWGHGRMWPPMPMPYGYYGPYGIYGPHGPYGYHSPYGHPGPWGTHGGSSSGFHPPRGPGQHQARSHGYMLWNDGNGWRRVEIPMGAQGPQMGWPGMQPRQGVAPRDGEAHGSGRQGPGRQEPGRQGAARQGRRQGQGQGRGQGRGARRGRNGDGAALPEELPERLREALRWLQPRPGPGSQARNEDPLGEAWAALRGRVPEGLLEALPEEITEELLRALNGMPTEGGCEDCPKRGDCDGDCDGCPQSGACGRSGGENAECGSCPKAEKPDCSGNCGAEGDCSTCKDRANDTGGCQGCAGSTPEPTTEATTTER